MSSSTSSETLREKFGWFVIPFTYGDEIQGANAERNGYVAMNGQVQQSKPVTYNGLISSINLLVVMVTLSSSISLTPFLTSDSEGNVFIDNLLAEALLTSFMILGLITMCFFVAFQDRILTNNVSSVCRSSERILFVAGLVMFYVFGCILDLFHALATFQCDDIWKKCSDDIYKAYVIDVTFHVTRILYLGGSALFTIAFYSAKFWNMCSVRYGLVIIMAGNVALWFDILLHESEHRQENKNGGHHYSTNMTKYCPKLTAHHVNQSQFNETASCLDHTTPLFLVLNRYIVPYCYPFAYESTLLVGERLIHWFFGCRDPAEVGLTGCGTTGTGSSESDTQQLDRMSSINDDDANDDSSFSDDDDDEHDNETGSLVTSSRRAANSDATPNTSHPVLWTVFFLATISLNILLFLLSVLPSVYNSINYGATTISSHFVQYTIFYYIMMICTITAGYAVARKFRVSKHEPFVGLDYLLILSSIGPFGYNLFALVAIGTLDTSTMSPEAVSIMSIPVDITLQVANICEIYYQIPFCFFAARVVAIAEDDRQCRNAPYFKAILLHLAVCNATLWLVNSFASPYNSDFLYIQSAVFGRRAWQFVNNFFLPLTLFFRFNSFLLIARALRKSFKKHNLPSLQLFVQMPR